MQYYSKDGEIVGVNDKFIYHIEVYISWKNGMSIYDDTYYSSSKPLKFKKNLLKRKTYKIIRYVNLEFAPKDYLERNGYKESN